MSDALILILGLIGIAGSLAIAIADLLLLVSDKRIPMIDRVGDISERSQWRVFVGGPAAACIAFPLWAIGMIPVAYGLQGSWASWPGVIGISLFAYIGIYAHGTFPFVGSLIGVQERYKHDETAQEALAAVREKHDAYFRFIVLCSLVVLLVGSVFFSIAVWSGDTRYPQAFALANPFLWILFHMSTLKWTPHGFSRWWRPMSVHLFFTPFYILSTHLLLA
ncbi:MAG: DUF6796 family protein [Pseudomonadota bacterium]